MALDYSIIGIRIKRLREKKQITQEELAEKLNVTSSTISRIERGTLRVSLPRLHEISRALGVKEGKILNDAYFSSPYYLSDDIANSLKNSSVNHHKAIYEICEVLNKHFHN